MTIFIRCVAFFHSTLFQIGNYLPVVLSVGPFSIKIGNGNVRMPFDSACVCVAVFFPLVICFHFSFYLHIFFCVHSNSNQGTNSEIIFKSLFHFECGMAPVPILFCFFTTTSFNFWSKFHFPKIQGFHINSRKHDNLPITAIAQLYIHNANWFSIFISNFSNTLTFH